MKTWSLFLFFCTLISNLLSAQTLIDQELTSIAEDLFSRRSDDISYDEFYDQLLLIYQDPIDLNSVDENKLKALSIITDEQLKEIVNHRNRTGDFVSILELQGLESFEIEDIKLLRPFFIVQNSGLLNWKDLPVRIINANPYLIYRSDGNIANRSFFKGVAQNYPGGSWSGSFRFRISKSNDFSFGWNADRDRGERFLWAPSSGWYGFDFHSFHAQVIEKGWLKNLIVGDYVASFGQGLIVGSGFGVGKTSEPVSALRSAASGFRPYTSLAESGFFRGIASSIKFKPGLVLHLMLSKVKNDGQVIFSTDSSASIRSPIFSGFHRTETEKQNRKTWQEYNTALSLEWKIRNINGGLTANQTLLSLPLQPSENLYNQNYFRGDRNSVLGFYLNGRYRNWTGFSEFGFSRPSGGGAFIAGLLTSLSPRFDLSLVARNYQVNFQSLNSSSFSENTTTSNEQGIFIGWKYKEGRKIQLSGYTDYFRFPDLKFRVYKPSDGYEHVIRLIRTFSRKNFITFQFRQNRKEINSGSAESKHYEILPLLRNITSVQFDYSFGESLSGRTRFLANKVFLGNKESSGNMMIQDLFADFGKVDFSLRFAVFGSDDYESRLFAHERDVWLSYSFPSWYGYGTRVYALLQYKMSEKMTAWIKWSAVTYTDRTPTLNGIDESPGEYRSDLRIQFRWTF